MKSIGLVGLASIVAGALSAAVIGFAGPAQADSNNLGPHGYGYDYGYGYGYGRDNSDYPWLGQLFPSVHVPHVDTSVHH